MGNGEQNTYLSRRTSFSAAHRLHNGALSDAENLRLFGKCNSANGHGHNYQLEVTLRGPIDPKTGMVFNLAELKKIMFEIVEADFDHHNLNTDVPEFKTLNPTTENVARVIWDRLAPHLNGLLYEIVLWETEKNRVTYRVSPPEAVFS
jgi:6-pyruvoyltetrahydropterin/6-carboxytetrahydropterin synthase